MLKNQLKELGLTEKEATVYVALAETGRAVATTLCKRTGIPRATLYGILDSLIERGVVIKEQTQASSYFVISNPESFLRIFEKQEYEVQSKKKIALNLVDLLQGYIKNTHFSIPKVQIFEGKQSIEQMLYRNLPLWRESCAKDGNKTVLGYQDSSFVDGYPEWHQYVWSQRDQEERICLFSNKVDLKKERSRKVSNREIKTLPEGIVFSSSIWLYGEYIVMGITNQKPHYVIQMKDAILSANLRAIFELLWKANFK